MTKSVSLSVASDKHSHSVIDTILQKSPFLMPFALDIEWCGGRRDSDEVGMGASVTRCLSRADGAPCLQAVPGCIRGFQETFSIARAAMGNLVMPLDLLRYTDMIAKCQALRNTTLRNQKRNA